MLSVVVNNSETLKEQRRKFEGEKSRELSKGVYVWGDCPTCMFSAYRMLTQRSCNKMTKSLWDASQT